MPQAIPFIVSAAVSIGSSWISSKISGNNKGGGDTPAPAPALPAPPDPAKVAEDKRKEAKRRASLKTNTLLTPASGLGDEKTAKKTLLGA